MENKVLLYNSSDIKIGETYARRARQLVKQQRAMWIDDTQTAIRFAPGMENMDTTTDIAEDLAPNQLCFAPYSDGYYYPAVISDVRPHIVNVAFLDGYSSKVSPMQVIGLKEAFDTLHFECKWGWLGFYRGMITSREPIIFHYDDGEVEQVELRNLRGVRYGHPLSY